MRLLELFAIFVVATLLAGFSCFAQSARSSNQTRSKTCSKTLSPATAGSAQQPGAAQEKPPEKAGTAQQDSSGRAQSNQTTKIAIESLQKAIQEAREREQLQPYRLLSGKSSSDSLDGGIYLRQTDGANVCAAIVSYNFSSGENPRLESVTTCTPGNAVTSKRARGPNKMPQGPHVVRTNYREQDKK